MGLKVSVGVSQSAAKTAREERVAAALVLLTSRSWRPVGTKDAPSTALPLLERAAAELGAPGPWPIRLQGVGGSIHGFWVEQDGSVQAHLTGRTFDEVWPAGTVRTPRLLLVGAHPGSGVSTWAQLLGGLEVSPGSTPPYAPLVVARSTLAGVNAAKAHARTAGAILLVADAPGSVPADVRRTIRVLAGAAGVVRAPWINALRGVTTIPETTAVTTASEAVMTSLTKQWRYAE